MLPPFIIEQIRKREEREKQERDQTQPMIEIVPDLPRVERRSVEPEERDRGVVVIDL